jgi:hypothetical protein
MLRAVGLARLGGGAALRRARPVAALAPAASAAPAALRWLSAAAAAAPAPAAAGKVAAAGAAAAGAATAAPAAVGSAAAPEGGIAAAGKDVKGFKHQKPRGPRMGSKRREPQWGYLPLVADDGAAFGDVWVPSTNVRVDETKGKQFVPQTALQMLRGLAIPRNVDETLEVCVELNSDVRKGDQIIRSSVNLPHGHGREKVRVLLFRETVFSETNTVAYAMIEIRKVKVKKTDKARARWDDETNVKRKNELILLPDGDFEGGAPSFEGGEGRPGS